MRARSLEVDIASFLRLGEPPSLLVAVRKMDGKVGHTGDDATSAIGVMLPATLHLRLRNREKRNWRLSGLQTILKFHFPQHYIEGWFKK